VHFIFAYCTVFNERINDNDDDDDDHDIILWSNRLKYLGAYFKSSRNLLVDNETTIRKFYAAANAIYGHVKFASKVTVLFSMEAF